jgi:hypothetical protein
MQASQQASFEGGGAQLISNSASCTAADDTKFEELDEPLPIYNEREPRLSSKSPTSDEEGEFSEEELSEEEPFEEQLFDQDQDDKEPHNEEEEQPSQLAPRDHQHQRDADLELLPHSEVKHDSFEPHAYQRADCRCHEQKFEDHSFHTASRKLARTCPDLSLRLRSNEVRSNELS